MNRQNSRQAEAWLQNRGDGTCGGTFRDCPTVEIVLRVAEDGQAVEAEVVDTFRMGVLETLVFPVEGPPISGTEYPAKSNPYWRLRRQDSDRYPWILTRSTGGAASSSLIP